MGLCLSSGSAATEASASALPPKDTALVMLPTGELREYPRPATAAQVLEDSATDGWFLCDSDRMGFEGAVAAVGSAEPLRAGRIYFFLPADARRRGLRREEVAELAVKASAALATKASSASGAGSRRRHGAAVAPLVFAPAEEDDEEEETAVDVRKALPAAGKRRRPTPRPRRPSRRFAPGLTAIPEGELSERVSD